MRIKFNFNVTEFLIGGFNFYLLLLCLSACNLDRTKSMEEERCKAIEQNLIKKKYLENIEI